MVIVVLGALVLGGCLVMGAILFALAPARESIGAPEKRAAVSDRDAARRLARAIVSDIRLYNAEVIASGGDVRGKLAREIAEGRALFASRVAAEHLAYFDDALEELR